MKRIVMLLVVLMTVSGARALAHHSQAAVYQGGKKIALDGEIVQILIRSPHSFVHISAKDENGEVQRWAVEWGGAGQLSRTGVDGKTLKIGDHVIIEANPGRNPLDHRALMVTITRPSDGFTWGRRAGEVVD